MKNLLGGNKKENIGAVCVGVLALILLSFSFGRDPTFNLYDLILALILLGTIVLADRYPIHIRYATKVSMISVPLFLSAALLPRSLAIVCGSLGMLLAAWFMRKERGLILIDFIIDPARWAFITFCASSVVHSLPTTDPLGHLLLLPGAVVMLFADILTFSLFTSFNTSEPVAILIRFNTLQVFALESIQYLIAILGCMSFHQAFWSLAILFVPIMIVYRSFKNLKEMNRGTREMLVNMADAIDLRDPYTGGHSRRVAQFTRIILREMEISGAEADLIETAAQLHDIGKVAIPDSVLHKPGDFTPGEREVMQSHSEKSSLLLSRYPDFSRGAEIVLSHHEQWDGKGYPNGLKEYAIPLGARIIAVADAFDAMITDRPYRPAKTLEQAISTLRAGRATQWDQEVVDIFVRAIVANPPEVPARPGLDNNFLKFVSP
jgi:HD-GYP domain-containing protein (c-di-GMP phosphodiesterase class II)